MEERTRALGGDIDIVSRPGAGVTIRVRVPAAVLRPEPASVEEHRESDEMFDEPLSDERDAGLVT